MNWNTFRVLNLDQERICVVNPAVPAWTVTSVENGDILKRLQQNEYVHPKAQDQLSSALNSLLRPELPRRPSHHPEKGLYIELLNSCNLKCIHCYNESGDTSLPRYSIPSRTVFEMLDEAPTLGFESVTFSGGEPLIRPDLFDFLKHAQGAGLRTTVVTNGILIKDHTADELKRLNASVTVSLEGASAETHDYVRGKGSFEKTLRGVDRLINGGQPRHLSFSMVVNRMNQHELAAMVDLCQLYRVDQLQIIFITYQGRAIPNWHEFRLDREDVARLCKEIFELQQDLVGILEIENEVVSTAIATLMFGGGSTNYSCSVCSQIRVDYRGNVHPCAFFNAAHYMLGNVIELGSLKQALRQASPIIQEIDQALYNRDKLVPQVKDCTWGRYCGGGCMAQSTHRDGTVWNVSDLCCEIREALYLHVIGRMTPSVTVQSQGAI